MRRVIFTYEKVTLFAVAAKKKPTKRMGRPAVPDDQRLTVQIGLNMTQSDWELLESTAEERGVRPAELLRQLIRGLTKQKAGSPTR